MKPILSVIVPVYNCAATLPLLMKDFRTQNFPQAEILLIDDGSTDGSAALCDFYAREFPGTRTLHRPNGGVSAARNAGLAMAQGEWVAFLDGDDRILPDFWRTFHAVARTEDSDVLICGYTLRPTSGLAETHCAPPRRELLLRAQLGELLSGLTTRQRSWLLDNIWNKWYRRELIAAHQIRYAEGISHGEDFLFNAAYFTYANRVSLLPQEYYVYQPDISGLMNRFRREPWIQRRAMLSAHKALNAAFDLGLDCASLPQLQAGHLAFYDLRTIASPNCPLSHREQLRWLREWLSSDQRGLAADYLAQKSGLAFRLYGRALTGRHPRLAWVLIHGEELVRRLTGRARI